MTTDRDPSNPYYRSLIRRMILTIILVSITPMILVTGIILYQFHKSYQKKVYAHLEELVQKHKQNIDSFLSEKLSDIGFLANSFSFEKLSDPSFLRNQLTSLHRDFGPVFVDLGVIDARGHQLAYAGPYNLANAEYSNADWIKKAVKTDYFISDIFYGLRKLPHFIVAVKNTTHNKTWLLRSAIDIVAFNNLVENIHIGKTGSAFILNRNGELQTKSLVDIKAAEEFYLEFFTKEKADQDKIYLTEKKDGSGRKIIYAASFLKNGDWLLVYQQNVADAFSELKQAQKTALLIIFLGSLGIISTALLLCGRMVDRIARADREKEVMSQQVVETGKLASIGELAAGIAHEINNPVAIMVEEAGWIGDLLEEEDFKEGENLSEFRRSLDQIATQGQRCKEITHKLLSFARKTDSRIQETQLNELIEDVVSLSEQRAKYSKVEIQTHLDESLPAFKISQTEMQQVLMNLINNAMDAMDKKGGSLDISSRVEGDDLIIEVADSGPGIPEANLARIFDPFFTTKPVGKGTGLGLSICYGIVRKWGGKIVARSAVGSGTTFGLHLPILQTADQEGKDLPDKPGT